jgi:UDP-2,3-diacylglucosamine pyrophosphatase LpxH
MLVVISDLHFEEEASDRIGPSIQLTRNFSPEAFVNLKKWLIIDKIKAGADVVDVVLAGDIFDMYRTSLWFKDKIRPWDDPKLFAQPGPHEDKILAILNAIANPKEPDQKNVVESLEAIKLLKKPPLNATIHYLPGNHDRLANASASIRARVSDLLGVKAPTGSFPNMLQFSDPPVLIRHGHEYDPFNFSTDHTTGPVPCNIPPSEYNAPTFGDFITVEVLSYLPVLFRDFGKNDSAILANNIKKELYLRLLEFDDVRPPSALLDYLLTTPGTGLNKKKLWEILQPVAKDLLDKIRSQPFLSSSIWALRKNVGMFWVMLLKLLLWCKVWNVALPLWVLQIVSSMALNSGSATDATLIDTAKNEEGIASQNVRAVIAGHTHDPKVELLGSHGQVQQYYIDTGTWRNRILCTPNEKTFGKLKALTYVVVYGKNEDPPGMPKKIWSFDYWSGYTQRWSIQ